MPATLTSPAGQAVKGKVRAVAPSVDPQTRNGLVYVDLPPTPAVRAGMFARGEFELGRSPAVTLPQTAVVLREGFAYLFRLEGEDRVVQTKVDAGRSVNGERVEVLGPACRRGAGGRIGCRLPGRWRRREGGGAMNVSSWSIRNPTPAILFFLLLTLAGLIGFQGMKIQQFMDIELPMVTVTASLPGAAPAQMETEVARKIENSVATLQGVKHIYTKVQDGTAIVTVEFRLEKPTQEAVDDVRDAVSRIRADLPGDLKDPVVSKVNLSGAPILTYTVASPRMDDEALSWFVDNTVSKALLSARGVGAVARVGGVTREVRVELDPARMLALNATAADISRQLKRIQQEASGGKSDIGGIEQSVRTLATVQSADELGGMDIVLSDGRHVRLDQVAKISDTVGEQRTAALLNGKPVVGFEVTRSKGAGEIEVRDAVLVALGKLKGEHPDIEITEAFNFVDPVVENYEGSMKLLIEGAILAVMVVWLFLRDARATFVSAAALPLSAIPTFAVMYLMGFTLNVVTLLSMSLVVGILVDDAIVEIENIMRHLRMGKTPYQAAMEAADEIGLAVIATTFTLIAVFLPTAFMSGVAGKFFVQFGWTAAIAVFFSLVVARMLTPMMAAYILKPVADEHAPPRWLVIYEGWAAWCLRHRLVTMLAATIFFVGSFMLVPLLPKGFLPPDDLSQTQIYLTLPPGVTFKDSFAAAEQARAIAEANPHVKLVYTAVGGGKAGSDPFAPQGAAEVRKATLTLNLTPRQERPGVTKQDIEGQLREALSAIPGAQIKVGLGSASGEIHPGAGQRKRAAAGRAGPRGRTRAAQHPGHRQRHLHGQPGPPGAGHPPRFRAHGRPRRDFGGHRRHAAHRHRRRLRPGAGQAQPGPAPGAHCRQAAARSAHRPGPARTPDRARQERPRDDRSRRQPEPLRRPGRDRPLRPPAQHQFRDRAERPAARRGGSQGAGPAQHRPAAAGHHADHGG